MKGHILSLLAALLLLPAAAQTTDGFGLREAAQADFSPIWLAHQDRRLGFISDHYQRLMVHFTDIRKAEPNSLRYLVRGKTRVDGAITPFQGELIVQEASMAESGPALGNGQQQRGRIRGSYTFTEAGKGAHVGTFTGKFTSSFALDENGVFCHEDPCLAADSIGNNAFQGRWVSRNGRMSFPANWGDYRIPASRDLDQGKDRFMPNPRYLREGWKNYSKAYGPPTPDQQKAQAEEHRPWWK